MVSLNDLPSISAVFSAYASITAFIMLVQTMVNLILPRTLQEKVISTLLNYFKPRTPTMTLIIEENTGMTRNQIYDDSETYLCTKCNANTDSLKITKSPKDKHVNLKFAQEETISDSFEGIELQWKFVCTELKWNGGSPGNDFNDGGGISKRPPARNFELRFDKKHKKKVLESYVPFVLKKAKMIREEKRVVKLHTLSHSRSYSGSSAWDSIYLEHPSTFDKLAMEPSLKRAVIDDLDRFVEREGYYRKVGKAWKRGYLLCGPPGTGKSSLVAAMANYLRFDVYDLQLSNITSDWSLRELLLSTTNKSILVIEDIDCSVELPERERKLSHHNYGRGEYRPRDLQFSLSGLLNFIDGLWSSCGDERIIIFTTNNKDKLDPALLRPGRMDMHVYMSYLTADGFRLLASNYLNIHSRHARFDEIEELIESMKVTPAEVAEELMKSDDADLSLGGLVDFLKQKKMESCKLKG